MNKIVKQICSSRGDCHNEDYGTAKAGRCLDLLGNAEERTDSEELVQHDVIDQSSGNND